MVLFLKAENIIYAKNEKMKKEEIAEIADAVWYDGEFSFFDGENKEGFYKVFKWDGKKPVIEYQQIPEEQDPEKSQLDNIEQTQLMLMEAMADQYEQRLETDLMMMDAQATTFEAVLALTEGKV